MKTARRLPSRRRNAGIAALEFAIVLPLLVLLALPVIDIGRAIQANLILMSLAREGANLASRGPYSLKDESQSIMGALVATTPPLDMNQRGMIYITRIMGKKVGGVISNVVIEQYRWNGGRYAAPSRIWNCGSWGTNGSCANVPTPAVGLMAGALAEGEIINVVESYYNFNAFFSRLVPAFGPDSERASLRAMAIF
jgi:hypothetical protein